MDNNQDLDFKLFFDLNLDLLCVNNFKGGFENVNKAFETILGYTLQDLQGLTAANLVHPDDLLSSIQALSKINEGAKAIHFNNRIRSKSGEYKTIEWKNYPKDGYLYATGRDITNSLKKRNELHKNQVQLKAIINGDSSFLFRLDMEGKYSFCNQSYIDNFLPHLTIEQVLGKNIKEIHSNENFEYVSGDVSDCMHNIGKNYALEMKKTLADGTEIYSIWDCICLADSEGKPSEIQMIGIDITEKRKHQHHIKVQKELELLEQSMPISKLWQGILFLPLSGVLTGVRAQQIFANVLQKIADSQAKIIILDIIAMPNIDKEAANFFIKLTKATKLMGCICTMSGISPAIAQILINEGIEIEEINTTANMKDALERAMKEVGLQLKELKEIK